VLLIQDNELKTAEQRTNAAAAVIASITPMTVMTITLADTKLMTLTDEQLSPHVKCCMSRETRRDAELH